MADEEKKGGPACLIAALLFIALDGLPPCPGGRTSGCTFQERFRIRSAGPTVSTPRFS